jgi:hypothetical protein
MKSRRNLTVLVFATLAVCQARAQGVSSKKPDMEAEKAEVLAVEAEVDKALVAADANTLDRIYTDELSYTNQVGEILTKAQVLAAIRSGGIRLPTLGRADIRLYAYPNMVILTGISTSTLNYNGVITNKPRRFANVYVNQNSQWKLAAHTVTEIAK